MISYNDSMNPYTPPTDAVLDEHESKTPNPKLPLRIVVSAMVCTTALLLVVFLAFAGARHGFKWPGLIKSIACVILFSVSLTYTINRGAKDVASINDLPPERKEVGVAHAGVIMLF